MARKLLVVELSVYVLLICGGLTYFVERMSGFDNNSVLATVMMVGVILFLNLFALGHLVGHRFSRARLWLLVSVVLCGGCCTGAALVSREEAAFVPHGDGEVRTAVGPAFVWSPGTIVRPKLFTLSVKETIADGNGGYSSFRMSRGYTLVPEIVANNIRAGHNPPTASEIEEEALRIIDATPPGPDFDQRVFESLDRALFFQGLRLAER